MSEYEEKILKLLSTIVDQTKPQPPKPVESSDKPKTSTELINLHTHTPKEMFDCPTCGPAYLPEAEKRLRPKFEQEQREKIKAMSDPNWCPDCGEIYDGNKEDDCPNCRRKTEQ
jgi:hypothetical protein